MLFRKHGDPSSERKGNQLFKVKANEARDSESTRHLPKARDTPIPKASGTP